MCSKRNAVVVSAQQQHENCKHRISCEFPRSLPICFFVQMERLALLLRCSKTRFETCLGVHAFGVYTVYACTHGPVADLARDFGRLGPM